MTGTTQKKGNEKISKICIFGDLSYNIKWEQRRNMYLRIYEDGRIQLSVPLRCSEADARKLISEKRSWICRKLEVMKKRREVKAKLYPEFVDGETLCFYDERLNLKLVIDQNRNRSHISREEDTLIIKTNSDDNSHLLELVKNWYVKAGKDIFVKRADYYAPLMGVTYGKITIKNQKTRWGSCSSKGNLNFCWKLLMMPEKLLDYVVVHELAHRHDIGHTKEFWKKVSEIMPDYKLLDHELNKY